MRFVSFVGLGLALWLSACRAEAPGADPVPRLMPQDAGTDVLFIGADAVDARTVWLAGTQGTYAWTRDGGASWTTGVVPGADTLQFRDVHAVSADTAFLLSIGPGPASRIYHTTDAGRTWRLSFQNDVPEAFFDCMDFWDARHGIAFSDAVDGRFPVIITADGGRTWQPVSSEALPPALPPALPGEGSFAASGTCLTTVGDRTALFGTAAAATARVFRTDDRGRTWRVSDTPVVAGETAGLATLAFRDALHGVAMGGDLAAPDSFTTNVAVTRDGGRTWRPGTSPPFPGPVYGSAYVPGASPPTLIAVGPRGAAFSTDDAASWMPLDTLEYWSLALAGPEAGWLVGRDGRITKVSLPVE
ncbi:MAG: hypothetical protein D6685_11295 [Bacteroidetes bacterium]|nr:MAG: hypothetical protein D6685_11295 [Bacteroidota bacterium]